MSRAFANACLADSRRDRALAHVYLAGVKRHVKAVFGTGLGRS